MRDSALTLAVSDIGESDHASIRPTKKPPHMPDELGKGGA